MAPTSQAAASAGGGGAAGTADKDKAASKAYDTALRKMLAAAGESKSASETRSIYVAYLAELCGVDATVDSLLGMAKIKCFWPKVWSKATMAWLEHFARLSIDQPNFMLLLGKIGLLYGQSFKNAGACALFSAIVAAAGFSTSRLQALKQHLEEEGVECAALDYWVARIWAMPAAMEAADMVAITIATSEICGTPSPVLAALSAIAARAKDQPAQMDFVDAFRRWLLKYSQTVSCSSHAHVCAKALMVIVDLSTAASSADRWQTAEAAVHCWTEHPSVDAVPAMRQAAELFGLLRHRRQAARLLATVDAVSKSKEAGIVHAQHGYEQLAQVLANEAAAIDPWAGKQIDDCCTLLKECVDDRSHPWRRTGLLLGGFRRLADLFLSQGDPHSALHYLKKALVLAQQIPGDTHTKELDAKVAHISAKMSAEVTSKPDVCRSVLVAAQQVIELLSTGPKNPNVAIGMDAGLLEMLEQLLLSGDMLLSSNDIEDAKQCYSAVVQGVDVYTSDSVLRLWAEHTGVTVASISDWSGQRLKALHAHAAVGVELCCENYAQAAKMLQNPHLTPAACAQLGLFIHAAAPSSRVIALAAQAAQESRDSLLIRQTYLDCALAIEKKDPVGAWSYMNRAMSVAANFAAVRLCKEDTMLASIFDVTDVDGCAARLRDMPQSWTTISLCLWRGRLLIGSAKGGGRSKPKFASQAVDEAEWLAVAQEVREAHLMVKRSQTPATLTRADTAMGKAVAKLGGLFDLAAYEPRLLILSGILQELPWEGILPAGSPMVCRLPSISFAWARLDRGPVSMNGGAFVIDPECNLPRTATKLSTVCEALRSDMGWSGIISNTPTTDQFQSIMEGSSILLYCGHGAGSQWFGRSSVQALNQYQNCTALLMGCSSAALEAVGEFEPTGNLIWYLLAGCPAVVGMLWDVTDRDVDRFTLSLVSTLQVKDSVAIEQAVASARTAVQLPHFTGCAPVVYGVPTIVEH